MAAASARSIPISTPALPGNPAAPEAIVTPAPAAAPVKAAPIKRLFGSAPGDAPPAPILVLKKLMEGGVTALAPEDVPVVASALESLAPRRASEHLFGTLCRRVGVAAICAPLSGAADAVALHVVARAIVALGERNPGMMAAVRRAGGVPALADALERNSSAPAPVLMLVCDAIKRLAFEPATQEAIASTRIVKTMASMLSSGSAVPILSLVNALAAVTNGDAAAVAAAVDSDAVRHVVGVLRAQMADAVVAEAALVVLYNVLAQQPSVVVAKAFTTHSGVALACDALRKHPRQGSCTSAALSVVGAAAQVPGLQAEAGKPDVVRLVVTTVRTHMAAGGDDAVLDAALASVYLIVSIPGGSKIFSDLSGADIVQDILRDHVRRRASVGRAYALLATCTDVHTSITKTTAFVTALELLRTADEPVVAGVVTYIVDCMEQMQAMDESYPGKLVAYLCKLMNLGIIGAVGAALRKFSFSPVIVARSCALLKALVDTNTPKPAYDAFVAAAGFPAIVSTLRTDAVAGIGALASVFIMEGYASLLAAEAVPALEAAAEAHKTNARVVTPIRDLLEKLAAKGSHIAIMPEDDNLQDAFLTLMYWDGKQDGELKLGQKLVTIDPSMLELLADEEYGEAMVAPSAAAASARASSL